MVFFKIRQYFVSLYSEATILLHLILLHLSLGKNYDYFLFVIIILYNLGYKSSK